MVFPLVDNSGETEGKFSGRITAQDPYSDQMLAEGFARREVSHR
jgi:hypothetical protein